MTGEPFVGRGRLVPNHARPISSDLGVAAAGKLAY